MAKKRPSRPPNKEEFFTAETAAEFLGLSYRQFMRLNQLCLGPAKVHLSERKIIYLREDIMTWLRQHRRVASA